MLRQYAFLFIPLAVLAALGGCSGGTNPAQQTATDSTKEASAAKNSGKPADNLPGLKELNETDRKLAEEQKICPVSGDPLGAMGKPYKMTVKGRVFFLCCDGCKDAVDKDPDGVLKKLDALLAKK